MKDRVRLRTGQVLCPYLRYPFASKGPLPWHGLPGRLVPSDVEEKPHFLVMVLRGPFVSKSFHLCLCRHTYTCAFLPGSSLTNRGFGCTSHVMKPVSVPCDTSVSSSS